MYKFILFLFLGFLIYLQKFMYTYGVLLLEKIIINDCNNINDFSNYKKKYIVKNICKSILLFLILLIVINPFINGFIYGIWSNLTFHICGCLYTAIDLGGLIYVKGLPKSTIIHHITTTIIGILNIFTNYEIDGYYKSFLIYCFFSIIPFIVNFYLGARYIISDNLLKKKIAKISCVVYGSSLFFNILCEIILFFTNEFSYSIFFYIIIFIMILNDDIILIKFLKKESE
jgi:hypothetical protein